MHGRVGTCKKNIADKSGFALAPVGTWNPLAWFDAAKAQRKLRNKRRDRLRTDVAKSKDGRHGKRELTVGVDSPKEV
jgi:hypothetical protein